jgi:hypothetical protein
MDEIDHGLEVGPFTFCPLVTLTNCSVCGLRYVSAIARRLLDDLKVNRRSLSKQDSF